MTERDENWGGAFTAEDEELRLARERARGRVIAGLAGLAALALVAIALIVAAAG